MRRLAQATIKASGATGSRRASLPFCERSSNRSQGRLLGGMLTGDDGPELFTNDVQMRFFGRRPVGLIGCPVDGVCRGSLGLARTVLL